MTAPILQVYLFLPLSAAGRVTTVPGNYFTLDDPVKGLLDNVTYGLAPTYNDTSPHFPYSSILSTGPGAIPTGWIDVSPWLTGQFSSSRGRTRETDQFISGTCTFTLRNENQYFDPFRKDNPNYSIPVRTPIRAYLAGTQIYAGFVDDVQAGYIKPKISAVTITCLDAFAILANVMLSKWSWGNAFEDSVGGALLNSGLMDDPTVWGAVPPLVLSGGANWPYLVSGDGGVGYVTVTAGSSLISSSRPFFPTSMISEIDYVLPAYGGTYGGTNIIVAPWYISGGGNMGTVTLPVIVGPPASNGSLRVIDSQHAQMLDNAGTPVVAGGSGVTTNASLVLYNWSNSVAAGALIQSNIFDKVSLLTVAQLWAISDGGYLFIDKAGLVQFYPRWYPSTLLANMDFASSVNFPFGLIRAYFADTGTGVHGPYGYTDIAIASESTLLYNRITGLSNTPTYPGSNRTPTIPLLQEADDIGSQQQYQLRVLALPGLELANDVDVLSLCQFFLGRYSNPEPRFDSVSVELSSFGADDQAVLCNLELMNPVQVSFNPPGSSAPTVQKSLLEGIDFNLDVSASTYQAIYHTMSLAQFPTLR